MLKINYSFIIPHKNSYSLLKRCLLSIPDRSDVEVIVVDDNSTDEVKSLLLDLELASSSNIRYVYSSKDIGAGAARNIGLDAARGKWICFADSDDFFNEGLSLILDKHKDEENIDIIFFKTNSVDSESLLPIKSRGNKYNKWIEQSVKRGFVDERIRYKINPVWGKFFSKLFIDKLDIRFDEVFAANDVMFSVRCGYFAKNIALSNCALYCATDCLNSIQKTTNFLYQESRFVTALNNYLFLKEHNKLKYRMNIWKAILRFWGVLEVKDIFVRIKKAFRIMRLQDFIFDFFPIPFTGIYFLLKNEKDN